ncbi:hypothetical protein ABE137_15590 [Brevibacillus laterosporus]|uniref:Uncharacterized protein n=1 Tax=Brevibacillus halotolerans TaxID=1507437 RepID=A0ABT4HW01_9BACL|nr:MULTISPECIES: hypothetical protein [Brevibacillus]MCR8984664.1 hypothetical protein [Brevibacillus laterosporus]MCZ0830390.1 hypothetical protein [Brevibacillus halotolerans]
MTLSLDLLTIETKEIKQVITKCNELDGQNKRKVDGRVYYNHEL